MLTGSRVENLTEVHQNNKSEGRLIYLLLRWKITLKGIPEK